MAVTLAIASERILEMTEVSVDVLGLFPGDAGEVEMTGPNQAAVARVKPPFDVDAFMANHRALESSDDREEAEAAEATQTLARMFGGDGRQ